MQFGRCRQTMAITRSGGRASRSNSTRRFLESGGEEGAISRAREARGDRGVWQRRFWEHTIANEDDFKRCLDYVHYNPVKHGLSASAREYPWSTFNRFVGLGEYELDWGSGSVPDIPGAEWE